jgi:hypothetical protein
MSASHSVFRLKGVLRRSVERATAYRTTRVKVSSGASNTRVGAFRIDVRASGVLIGALLQVGFMPKRYTCLSVTICLLALGCGTHEADPSAEPAAPAPAQRPIPARAAPADQTAVPENDLPVINQRELVAAATAAEHAPRGSDTCETAVNGLTAMLEAAESESPGGQRLPRPERSDFLAACRALPAPAQPCLVPVYAMAHQDECNRTLEALPPSQLEALQSAMESEPNE